MDKLRIGQINLQGSAVATAELSSIAGELGLDVVLVQEPYSTSRIHTTTRPSAQILASGDVGRVKSGILLLRRDVQCTILHHLSNLHCTVCHLGHAAGGAASVYVVSAYFQYSDDIALHIEHLNKVLDSLRGNRVLIAADCNAHSPMWHCEPRNYVARGQGVTYRRQQMEDFIVGRGLVIHNRPGEPPTFSTPNGESNIDVTLTTRGTPVYNWKVHSDVSSSDHRLITYDLGGTRDDTTSSPAAFVAAEPRRYRERGVDWGRYRCAINDRVGRINWRKPAREVCQEFTDILTGTADEIIGTSSNRRKNEGYEWWNPSLDIERKKTNKARKAWQNTKKRGIRGIVEEIARKNYYACRSSYRAMMAKAQTDFFRELADSGNQDPWGLAYRTASGRFKPPSNVIAGMKLAEGFSGDARSAMGALLTVLCPDDNPVVDTPYHRQVRLLASCAPAGPDAAPPSYEALHNIIKDLPSTAPGIDGVTARMVKHTWQAADLEITRVYCVCVEEGVFPDAWKDGRLIVIPKGNDRPLTDPKAYRPITLLSVLGKILERVILHCAPSISRGLSHCQHGFTRGRSTLTALRSIQDTVANSAAKYVQVVLLDISGAFDNAWWPMILLKAKNGGCPPNIYRMLVAYFNNRRVGLFVGGGVVWKPSTMGCPQGSVLGPSLWNLLMDDLFRLPFPAGVQLVGYADDVTVVIESNSRAGIEASASCAMALIEQWGLRNRLGFSPSKSYSMTLKGKMTGRPPTIRLGGTSVKSVQSAKVLGVVIDSTLSFGEHAQSIGERAAAAFGKMSRVSASSWGIRYRALKILYQGTYVATVTYAAGCWWRRANKFVVKSALLRTQRPALILLTKAYRSVSTAALPVLAGVLPADLEVTRAGRVDDIRHLDRDEFKTEKLKITSETVASWQQSWEGEVKGRELYRFFPEVEARLKFTWVEPDYTVSQILTGHGCFRKRLYDMKLCEESLCYCGEEDECLDHVLWRCPLYDAERKVMLDGMVYRVPGPVHYRELVDSQNNFGRLAVFARKWHKIRSNLELQETTMERTLASSEAVHVNVGRISGVRQDGSAAAAAPERGEGEGL